MPEKFHEWIKVIGKKQSERMPTRKLWDHAINAKEGFVPRKGKVYLLSREEREEVREFVKEQLRKGYIRPSKSPQIALVFFVRKKDRKKRMVQDYCYLNEWMIKNNYPLPLISDVLENIGTKKVFTKMDLQWGYNNVQIKEGNEWKAAFTTLEGSFEPTVMFFGLTNSPAMFQAMMNKLLRDLTNTEKVAVFIDNVIVGMEIEEGHDELVAEVIRRLEENDLYIKLEKCKWKVREVEFLGVVIGPEGIKMEKEKVKGVLEWLTLKCVKDVQKFLGLANYYCWFIKGFATVARPLHDLVKKDKRWEWTEREEKVFRELKERFTKELVLAAPDIDKKMRMEVDALDYATDGVLSMEYNDELWRPVAFLSKLLNETERNYEIHDKEMLAIIRGLKAWRHLLEGAQSKFEIWTDHKNLEYFMKVQKLNRRQARWALYLSWFDFTLKHVAGSKMGKADGLSRRADWKVGMDKDNSNQVFIKDNWIHSMYEVVVERPEVDLLEKIKKARSKDEDIVKVVEEMKKAGVRELWGNKWKMEGELVLKEGKVYVPKDEELRVEVIRLHYDVLAAGHGERWNTVELVTRNYWWPGVTRDIGKYVEGCNLCQRMKNRTEEPAGKLKLSEVPQKTWTHLTVDFITKLPVVAGKDAILVVCNRLSKMTHFVATTEGTSAEGLARLFRDNVWKLHGLLESVVSDRGPQFAAELMKELNRILGIKTKLSTAFHLQTDGQMERMNQELEQYLRLFIKHRQKDWLEWLAAAEFAINNKVHTVTKVSPFMANYGKELRMGGDIRRKGKVESATVFVERMRKVQEEAEAALRKTQEEMKKYAERGRKETEVWKKGDRVLLSTKDLVFKERPTKKLTERYMGPYMIEEVVLSNIVKLRLPSLMRIHPVVNVSWIVCYKEHVKGQKKEEGKPVKVEGIKEWEVEKILNKKKMRGVEKYLIRWKGFTAEGDTWERRENLKNADELIEEFEKGGVEVRQQEGEEREYKRMELPGKYTAKLLYGWDDRKFEEEYLNKLEKNWKK